MPTPTEGDVVEICGLVGAPHHNGQRGVVTGFDASKGRYGVRSLGAPGSLSA